MTTSQMNVQKLLKTLIQILCAYVFSISALAGEASVTVTETGKTVRVEINGQLFTEYYFKDVPRPYFYPVIGPTGKSVTRHWPMKDVENEEQDHIHHRSLWYAHGDVNGHDFWSEESGH